MSQFHVNEYEMNSRALAESHQRMELSRELFIRLKVKYGEAAVLKVITEECEVSNEALEEWFNYFSLSEGTAVRVYQLLRDLWANPRSSDFPNGPLPANTETKKVLPDIIKIKPRNMDRDAIVPKNAARKGGTAKRHNKRRTFRPAAAYAPPTLPTDLPTISTEEAQRLLEKFQSQGGVIRADYQPDK